MPSIDIEAIIALLYNIIIFIMSNHERHNQLRFKRTCIIGSIASTSIKCVIKKSPCFSIDQNASGEKELLYRLFNIIVSNVKNKLCLILSYPFFTTICDNYMCSTKSHIKKAVLQRQTISEKSIGQSECIKNNKIYLLLILVRILLYLLDMELKLAMKQRQEALVSDIVRELRVLDEIDASLCQYFSRELDIDIPIMSKKFKHKSKSVNKSKKGENDKCSVPAPIL